VRRRCWQTCSRVINQFKKHGRIQLGSEEITTSGNFELDLHLIDLNHWTVIAGDASYHKDDRGYALARLVSMVPSNKESCEADLASYIVRGQSSVLLTYNPKVGLLDLQHFALP
jgi:hypothetical protein